MKRILLPTLALLLIAALAVFPAGAADLSAALTSPAGTVAPGELFTVTLALADSPKAQSVGVSLTLSAGLETVSSEWLASGLALSHYDAAKNKGAAARNDAGDFSGDLLRLTLRASEDCALPALSAEVTLKEGSTAVGSASASLALAVSEAPAAAQNDVPPQEPVSFPWPWVGAGAALLLIAALAAFLLLRKRKASSR